MCFVIDAAATNRYKTQMLNNRFPDKGAFADEELLHLALKFSEIAVWKVDPKTFEIASSTALNDILEIPSDQAVDYAGLMNFMHPDDRNQVETQIAAALDPAGDGTYRAEYRIVTASGNIKWLEALGKAHFTSENGKRTPSLFIGTLRDNTVHKDVEITLQAALEEKQALVHEVNHRVKNSLQLVSSLLRLQTRRIADPRAKQQLTDSVSRISAIAHIHQRLYRDQNVKQIDFGIFLSELCADLQGSASHCQLTINAPYAVIMADQAIPLALIVNELVTNAFKYAYPNGGGPVWVKVERPDLQKISIIIADNGIGLADDFSMDDTDSLGMVLIGSLLGQLSGKLDISRTEGGGATFIVSAPLDVI